MRRITILSSTLLLLAAAAGPAAAQGGMGGMMDPAQMVQRSTDRLMKDITLTATQQDSVKAINARQATEIQGAMSGGMDRSKMTEMRTKQRAELRGILTADQQKVFDKNVDDMEKARANRGAGGPPKP